MNQPQLGAEPTPLPATNLAGVFRRSDTLRGRLQPVRRPVIPSDEAVEAAEEVEPDTAPRTPTARKSSRREQTPKAPEPAPRAVIAYIPVSVRDRLRARRTADSPPIADIVLDAIEATHDRLGDLLAAQRPKVERSALFVRTTTPTAKSDEPNVQLYLRLSADNVGVIDQLVETHKAPSRSALIAAALDAYLD